MKAKISKTVSYPFLIITLIGAILFLIFLILNSIGVRMNPPQEVFVFEKEISRAVIWRSTDKEWMFSQTGHLAIFDIDTEGFKKEAEVLSKSSSEVFSEVLLLVVRESLNKEKAKTLLASLSHLPLKKVYIASPYDDTLGALKNLEPRFWYAASPRSWVKWSLFEAFGVEKAFTFEADFVFVDKEITKLLSEKLKQEINRRRLPMITVKEDGSLSFD